MEPKLSYFEFIQPYLQLVAESMGVDQNGKALNVVQFANEEDRFSSALLTQSAGLVAVQNQPLFKSNIGDAGGQGFTTTYPSSLTNNTTGIAMQKNEIYVATHMGFQFFAQTGTDGTVGTGKILSNFSRSSDLMALASSCQVSFQSAGLVNRVLGRTLDFPQPNGIYAYGAREQAFNPASTTAAVIAAPVFQEFGVQNGSPYKSIRLLNIPLIWPPQINVDMKILVQNAILLSDAAAAITASSTVSGQAAGQWNAALTATAGNAIVAVCTLQGFRATAVPRQPGQ